MQHLRSLGVDDVYRWLCWCALFVILYYIIIFRIIFPGVTFGDPRATKEHKPDDGRRHHDEYKKQAMNQEGTRKQLERRRQEHLERERQRKHQEHRERELQQENESRRAEEEKLEKERQARSLERRLRRIWMVSLHRLVLFKTPCSKNTTSSICSQPFLRYRLPFPHTVSTSFFIVFFASPCEPLQL
jgi:hypothetical protein